MGAEHAFGYSIDIVAAAYCAGEDFAASLKRGVKVIIGSAFNVLIS